MLNFIKMPKYIDKPIQISIYFLIIFGIFMITSATQGIQADSITALINTIIKQLIFTISGYIAMIIISRIFNFKLLNSLSSSIITITIVTLLLTLLFPEVSGAKAWIRFTIAQTEVTIQPSEIAKLSIILIISDKLGNIKTNYFSEKELLKIPLTFITTCIFIVFFLQKDFGTTFIILIISCCCLMCATSKSISKFRYKLFFLILISICLSIIIISPIGTSILEQLAPNHYQARRFLIAANPFKYMYDWGHQLIQSLIAISRGGLFGVGYGQSLLKYGTFPAADTDFIIAVVIEELGIVLGFLPIIIAYTIIVSKLILYAIKIPHIQSKIILIGIATYYLSHFTLNIGGATALLPLTGIPLLLISSGGTSATTALIAIGLAQNIISKYRQGQYKT